MDVVTVGDVMIDVRVDSDGLEEGGDVHGRVLVPVSYTHLTLPTIYSV